METEVLQMDKRFLAILAALAVLFIGIAVLSGSKDNSSDGNKTGTQATNHVIGEGKKSVTLTEYGDFQCPVCFAYEPALKQARDKYFQDIKFQFRNLPLIQIHTNAFAAARAAEAAGAQNKYWEMHDMLYEPTNWSTWTKSSNARGAFEGYAKQLGLDVNKFKQDYASGKVNEAINADMAEFAKTKQQMATPSFFINGRHVENSQLSDSTGAPSVDKISKLIEDEIAKQKQ
jgi:protein-disulfide isomerase